MCTSYALLLKSCAQKKDLCKGISIHADILRKGLLDKDSHIASMLVSMYARVGALTEAQQVLDELPNRDLISWSALIAGYVKEGHAQTALNCFAHMECEGCSPDLVTYTCILKACGSVGAIDKGKRFHYEIANKGLLERDVMLGNALVDMYARCGTLKKAWLVLEELPVRDIVSWSALITGYAHLGHEFDIWKCFQQMQCEGLHPDAVTFACLLKACGSIGESDKGIQIHKEIIHGGLLGESAALGASLIDMYVKCKLLEKAQQVIDDLSVRDVVSWSALITGYVQNEKSEEALKLFEHMKHEGLSPNGVTLMSIMRAYGILGLADKGKLVHKKMICQGLLEKFIGLGAALVDMYAKCNLLTEAQHVFDELPVRDVVSWTALITGYVEHAKYEETFHCFQQMQSEGISPNSVTYICIFKACANAKSVDKSKQVHDEIAGKGFLGKCIGLGTAVVDMYSNCGMLVKAYEVLEELSMRDVCCWSALIAGYAQQEQGNEALACFAQMQNEGLSPNSLTCICVLKACASIGAADKGKQVHDAVVKQGLLEKDPVLGTAIVDMYIKCGMLAKAEQLLNQLPIRDMVFWNTIIAGYAQDGQGYQALSCFDLMQLDGFCPEVATFVCILKACSSIGAVEKGKHIHDEIRHQGLLARDITLGTALIDMYAKCGALLRAQEVLNELPVWEVVSWNALISGYAHNKQGEEALKCYERMQQEGLMPDVITFICILKACGNIGVVETGKKVHKEIRRQGLLGRDVVLDTALVDMYAKCGSLTEAELVLSELPVRNAVSWNATIAGYAQYAQGDEALKCLERMELDGHVPDGVTFICVLNACSHSGLMDEGQFYMAEMNMKYGIIPREEHHNCMVDLLGRVGHFDQIMTVIKRMLFSDNTALWSAVLVACQQSGNVRLGEWAFDHAIQVDYNDATAYAFMTNIYASAGMIEDAKKIKAWSLKVARCM